MGELSPVRRWITQQLNALLPTDASEIRSDTNGILFKDWTNMTQSSLEDIWIAEDTQRVINSIASGKGADAGVVKYKQRAAAIIERAKYMVEHRQKEYADSANLISGVQTFAPSSMIRTVGVTTTCNAFLGVVVNKIFRAGGMAPRSFASFDLPKAGGKAWNWYPGGDNSSPQAGDFFQVGTRGGSYEHVGILLGVSGGQMTVANAGQGGPSAGYDSIKRGTRPINMMGWIDVDEFFKDWKGPGTAANN